jgi:hypothetical protein
MPLRLSPSLRAALYALRGGFLVRPLLIVLFLGASGAELSELEELYPDIRIVVPQALFPSQADRWNDFNGLLLRAAPLAMTDSSPDFAK